MPRRVPFGPDRLSLSCTKSLATRRKRANENFRPFVRRWDYLLRRYIRRVGLTDDATLLGTCMPIALAGPHISLLDAVAQGLEKPVRAIGDVTGPAVVCVTDPLRAPFVRGRDHPSVAVVGLVGDDAARWLRHPDLPAYDLLVTEKRETMDALRAAGAAAACAPRDVRATLAERAESPRVGLPGLWRRAGMRAARMTLARAGIASRVHGLARRRFIDDDVIVDCGPLSFPMARTHLPVIPLAPAESLVDRVLDADRAACRPPVDAPLPDLARRPFPADA